MPTLKHKTTSFGFHETKDGHRILPGTSIHLRIDTREVAEVEKAVLQGLRTTALGEVKWYRPLGQDCQPLYRIGIRYYPYY